VFHFLEKGLVEMFDPRQKRAAGKVSTSTGLTYAGASTAGANERGSEVTALRFNEDNALEMVSFFVCLHFPPSCASLLPLLY